MPICQKQAYFRLAALKVTADQVYFMKVFFFLYVMAV